MPQSRIDYEQNGANGGVEGFLNDMFGTHGRGDYKARLKMFLEQYGQRQAPQAGPAAQSATSGFRQNQNDLIGRLEMMSRGQGPSLAAQQLREATDRNQSAQASITAGGRGNAGLAGVMASNTSAQLGAQSAQQAASARIAEQQMALGQLGGAIGAGREQDQANSQFNALQTNYRAKDNLEAQLRTMGMNDNQISAILQQLGQAEYQPTTTERGWAGAVNAGTTYATSGANQAGKK